MLIQCTKKLLDRLHAEPERKKDTESRSETEEFFAWHANILTVDRRKVLMFVNNRTRLVVICYRPKPVVYKKMGEYLTAGIRELFDALGVHGDVTEQYLKAAGPVQIATTGSRSQIARMNKIGDEVCWHSLFFREDKEAPAHMKFFQLHIAIQKAFGWFNYHLHDFSFFEEEVRPHSSRHYYDKKRTMVIRDYREEEADDYLDAAEMEIHSDRELMLCDVFENRSSCVYTYDFGDNWEHVITVEERKKENGSARFRLLEKEGERPPEDVGGEGGFAEYKRIISNPQDPDYEYMKRWAEGTKAKEETIKEINIELGWI